jgi:nucleotide-binding universal stress UspA family protein
MFTRILVALKFGSASTGATLRAADLARAHGAELHVFHALDYALTHSADPEALSAARREAERRYAAQIRPHLPPGLPASFACEPADPALEICRLARTIGADLIVLGCHQNPEKMCLGRIDYVGITILEKAPCPVLLVPLCE